MVAEDKTYAEALGERDPSGFSDEDVYSKDGSFMGRNGGGGRQGRSHIRVSPWGEEANAFGDVIPLLSALSLCLSVAMLNFLCFAIRVVYHEGTRMRFYCTLTLMR